MSSLSLTLAYIILLSYMSSDSCTFSKISRAIPAAPIANAVSVLVYSKLVTSRQSCISPQVTTDPTSSLDAIPSFKCLLKWDPSSLVS